MTEFYAIKLSHNTFDVFEGTQWGATSDYAHNTSWSRLRGGRNGVYVQAGRSLPHGLVRELAAAINPKEDKQLVTLP